MSKSFTINWVGPFQNIDELKEWEQINNEDCEYNFYIITGKEKGKRTFSKYCGITDTQRGKLYCRFYDKSHKVYSLERDRNIWIGSLVDGDMRNRSNLELCETLIISYWQPEVNIKKKNYYPAEDVILINRWFNTNRNVRIRSIYPAQELSDVIIYDAFNGGIYGTERLKELKRIYWE